MLSILKPHSSRRLKRRGYSAILLIKLKGYFDLKNKAKEDESEKSKSL